MVRQKLFQGRSCISLLLFAVLERGEAGVMLEKLDKSGRVRKIEGFGNLSDGLVGGFQLHLYFYDDGFVDPFEDGTAGHFLYGGGKIFRCTVHLTGIEGHGTLLLVLFGKKCKKVIDQLLLLQGRPCEAAHLFLEQVYYFQQQSIE